jgi:hypothetical protein
MTVDLCRKRFEVSDLDYLQTAVYEFTKFYHVNGLHKKFLGANILENITLGGGTICYIQ